MTNPDIGAPISGLIIIISDPTEFQYICRVKSVRMRLTLYFLEYMRFSKRHVRTIVCVTAAAATALGTLSAKNYFADGYHGGIYGHYPVEWKTQFIVDKLTENPDWKIGLEIEPETWDTVRARTPGAFQAFAALLSQRRMEYTNPTYAQPYLYNIQEESIIRQFSYGIERLRHHFPGITFTTYAAEEPCFTSALPAILRGFGFSYLSLKCPDTCWGGYMAPFGGETVNLIGPDGTEMTAVPRYACEGAEPGSTWQTTAWRNDPSYLRTCRRAGIENPIGMCYQDAGWRNGPWLGANRTASEYTLWTDYIAAVAPDKPTESHHFTQEDIRVNLMWGSQVMQRIARQVRNAENTLILAEKIAAIAALSNATSADTAYFNHIDEAWRQLMLAQHHDSWIVPYNRLGNSGTWADAIKDWTATAVELAEDEIARATNATAAGPTPMVKVFNTTALSRREVVEAELPAYFPDTEYTIRLTAPDGSSVACRRISKRRISFEAEVPPFGFTTYSITADPGQIIMPEEVLPDSTATIGNDRISLTFDLSRGGAVSSLRLKDIPDVEFAPADTCRFLLGELRGFFYNEDRFRSSAETPATIAAISRSPLGESITLAGEIAGHPFRHTYTLSQGSDRIDGRLHIDWQGNPGIGEYRETAWRGDRRAFCDDRYKLCLMLPTAFNHDRLWKDAPFDVCESRQDSTFFNRWSDIRHNVILNWIDTTDSLSAQGLGLMTDHTTSYVHGPDHPVALTVQYSGPGLWGPDYRITGPTVINYALLPHRGISGAEALSDESLRFREPLRAVVCGGTGVPESRSVLSIDGEGYRLSAVHPAPDGTVTIRIHNTHGDKPATLTPAIAARIAETDLSGNRAGPAASGAVDTTAPRNGFRTFFLSLIK